MSLIRRVEQKQLHPAMLPREMRWRSVAYGCFLICGLLLFGAVLLHWLPTDGWVYLGMDWLYRRPVLLVFTVAALCGAAFSLVAWREWRLLVLSLATLLMALVPWIVMHWPATPDAAVGVWLALYLIMTIGGSLWWLQIDRRRILRRYPPRLERGWLEPEGEDS
jgi:hypothetical protein